MIRLAQMPGHSDIAGLLVMDELVRTSTSVIQTETEAIIFFCVLFFFLFT